MGEGEVTCGGAIAVMHAQMSVPVEFYLRTLREAGQAERATMRMAEEGARLAFDAIERRNKKKEDGGR